MKKTIGILAVLWSTSALAQQSVADYSNNLKMREDRRVGVGAQFGGTTGTIGALLELNVENQDGALIGFGTGNSFSTFSLAWKHSFEGMALSPYSTVGWSRWYNSSGTGKPSSHILDQMLSDDEKRESRFGIDLITAGIGAQYQELGGDFQGTSFFAELNLTASAFRGGLVPTAGLGALWFF